VRHEHGTERVLTVDWTGCQDLSKPSFRRMDFMGLGRKLARKVHRAASLRLQRDPVTGRAIQSIGRVVTLGDRLGSWTVPDLFLDRDSVVYCVGCGEDVTFDLALIDRLGCTVHAFDPTPRAIDHVAKVAGANPRYKFQPIGLWDSDTTVSFFAPANEAHVSHSIVNLQQTNRTFEAPVRRLKNVMADEGHEKLSLLKLDVEGAEYRILEHVSKMTDSVTSRKPITFRQGSTDGTSADLPS
jgi:FkbM family methyltransferase